MKKLKITTYRELSDEEYEDYKNQMEETMPGVVDFDKLEKTGKLEFRSSFNQEKVSTVYELEN